MQTLTTLPAIAACVRAIMNGCTGQQDLDLSSLQPYVHNGRDRERIVEALALIMIRDSESTSTIGMAGPDLFADRSDADCLYLVVCPFDTPEGVVSKRADGMVLLTLSITKGFFINAAPKPDRRQDALEWLRTQGQVQAPPTDPMQVEFLTALTKHLLNQAEWQYEGEVAKRISAARQKSGYMSLDDIVSFARQLGINIVELLVPAVRL